jgi:hypothetical protein
LSAELRVSEYLEGIAEFVDFADEDAFIESTVVDVEHAGLGVEEAGGAAGVGDDLDMGEVGRGGLLGAGGGVKAGEGGDEGDDDAGPMFFHGRIPLCGCGVPGRY